jgi:rod shape-determining protein MreC
MAFGTLDRQPPPLFHQGASARTRLIFFSALALFLMAADTRLKLVEPLRAGIATALLPVQRALAVPLEIWQGGGSYLQGLKSATESEKAAREQLAAASARIARAGELEAENQRLRGLLELQPALAVRSVAAEVLYEAADPYSRKVFVNRGSQHGVPRGAPAVNEAGVVGQVTRVYPFTAEVTLLTDRDAAIPVLNLRTQQRSAAFGGAGSAGGSARNPQLELRFVSGNADVQVGDLLHTSGLDGIYPSGLPVATVAQIERRSDAGFARIVLAPAARLDGVRHVLLLEPMQAQLPPRPVAEAASAPASAAQGVGGRRR